ncbi:hypothetical protein Leryth_010100 [Lithospermum erythrorhizon]|nr:hypothetical protein Leryth_010100 [Lithospermum erythrorhizon]
MLAAVLWLGNISFRVVSSENHIEVLDNEANFTASLLGCNARTLYVSWQGKGFQREIKSAAGTWVGANVFMYFYKFFYFIGHLSAPDCYLYLSQNIY